MPVKIDQPTATVQINGKYHKIPEDVSRLIADLTHQFEGLREKLRVLELQPMGAFAIRFNEILADRDSIATERSRYREALTQIAFGRIADSDYQVFASEVLDSKP